MHLHHVFTTASLKTELTRKLILEFGLEHSRTINATWRAELCACTKTAKDSSRQIKRNNLSSIQFGKKRVWFLDGYDLDGIYTVATICQFIVAAATSLVLIDKRQVRETIASTNLTRFSLSCWENAILSYFLILC